MKKDVLQLLALLVASLLVYGVYRSTAGARNTEVTPPTALRVEDKGESPSPAVASPPPPDVPVPPPGPERPALESSPILEDRVSPPAGFARMPLPPQSFGAWLRKVELEPEDTPVLLFDGREKPNQSAHHAVLTFDVGTRDLQQCADAVMRLRAEHLYSIRNFDDLHFNFTSGHRADYVKWRDGYRPNISGNRVKWRRTASRDTSYRAFRKYLDTVFTYAGTYSLAKELKKRSIEELKPGDVFIQGGFPGHAVIVMDVAERVGEGPPLVLLAQSYMPAQSIHVLVNPKDPALSPWYEVGTGERLVTPEWSFEWSDLRAFD